jgi:uncharacterized protein YndB with AHSA1/START domain
MTMAETQTLTITRRFATSPERLFDAWIDPKIAAAWLFTGPTSQAHQAELDARVGGRWRITDTRDSVTYEAIGEYLEIDRPRRLVFSFAMPQFDPRAARVTVEIAPDGAGSRLTLTQAPVPAEAQAPLEEGWRQMFEGLEKAA